MRRFAPLLLTALAVLASASFSAAVPGPDIAALARPLAEDLNKPEFFQSRCLLAPLLANDKRTIALSRDDTFHAGDRILAVNGNALSDTGDRALHAILIGYASDAIVTVRVLRAGSNIDVTAPCSDSLAYYASLRAAAMAAVQNDAATCADRMADAGKQHALGSIWLAVALNCSVASERVSGAPMLAEWFYVYHEELLENDFSPAALQSIRPSLQNAAQSLLNAGSRPLAEKLQQEFASAVADWAPLQGSALALQLVAPSVTLGTAGNVQQHEAPAPVKEDPRSNDPNRMQPGLYQVQINMGALVPTEKNVGPTFMRMCFNQAMIDAANPVPPSGQCDRYNVINNGKDTHIDFSCTSNGTSATGRSDETVNGNRRHSIIDVGTSDDQGTHTLHLDTEMIFLGSDCNGAYPDPPAPISVRHFRYESSIESDGRIFHLNAEYQCRLEGDPTATFNQLEWRLQGGMSRLKLFGKLPDGSRFKVKPLHLDWRIWDKNAGACPDNTKTIDSEIWMTVAGNPPRLLRFDRNHSISEHRHELHLIESKLVLDKTDSVPAGQPGLKPPPYVADSPQYYTVNMISVPAASVADHKGLQEFNEQKRIPWLIDGGIYPFTEWSDNDVTFARNYTSIFTTEDDRKGGPGEDAAGLTTYNAFPNNNEWRIDRKHRAVASEWLLMPAKRDADQQVPRPEPAAMTKTWIVYDGAHIEMPLFGFYRVLYDPSRGEYLLFTINRVDAD